MPPILKTLFKIMLFIALFSSSLAFAQSINAPINSCRAIFSRAASVFKPINFKEVNGTGKFLPRFESEPEIFRRLFLDEHKVNEIREQIKDLPRWERNKKAFDLYMEERLKGYPLWVKSKLQKAINEVTIIHDDIIAGAYHPSDNSTDLYLPKQLRESISFYKLLVHELEHSIQSAERTLKLSDKKRDRYFSEFGSVRAEWEFLSIFTDSQLDQNYNVINKSSLKKTIKYHLIELQRAENRGFAAYRYLHTYNSRYAVEKFYEEKNRESD